MTEFKAEGFIRCHDCAANLRMCRVTTIYSYPLVDREVRVYLIGEELGF